MAFIIGWVKHNSILGQGYLLTINLQFVRRHFWNQRYFGHQKEYSDVLLSIYFLSQNSMVEFIGAVRGYDVVT